MKIQVLLLVVSVPSLFANLITNGGFERPDLTGNTTSKTYAAGSTDIAGWLVTSFAPESVSIIRNDYTAGNLSFLPEQGSQSLNLTGDISGEAAGVRQHVTLTAGHEYRLSFWIGNEDNAANHYTLDSEAALLLDGNLVNFYSNGDNTRNALNWKEFFYSFTATRSNTTIEFQNSTLSFDREIGLDAVDLEDVTPQTSAPEVGEGPLFALGLLTLSCLCKLPRRMTR